tara:strand:+ start:2745 stop:3563 length:819 start_codon:yes stop_codon:yes gene_type:complete
MKSINKKSIPVIGIPIVNGLHWLKKLILSIDYPVDNVFIINNSGCKKFKEELENLREEIIFLNLNVINLHITHLPSNLGVPAAWNLIIKSFLMEPYWIISNHDVSFTPGLLEEIANVAQDKDVSLIHPRAGEFNIGTYDLFAITEMGVKIIGLFDENLYPAYGEDSDFIMRIKNLDPKTIKGLKNKYFHGNEIIDNSNESYYKNAQQTKKEDPQLEKKLEKVNLINFEYLNQKWGNHWRTLSPYITPFNNPEYPQSYTTWDLSFIRKKYLGF